MSYIWETRRAGTLYEMAILEAETQEEKADTQQARTQPGASNNGGEQASSGTPAITGESGEGKHENAREYHLGEGMDPAKVKELISGLNDKTVTFNDETKTVVCSGENVPEIVMGLLKKGILVDNSETGKLNRSGDTNEKLYRSLSVANRIGEKDPEIIKEIKIALRCLAAGMWIDGSRADGKRAEAVGELRKSILSGDTDSVKRIAIWVQKAITNGKVNIDPNNNGLYSRQSESAKIPSNIEVPALFETEADDSMWEEMVFDDFGIPVINLGHPAVKKIIASDSPEEDCPNDLKQFKKKIYDDPKLSMVFGKGGFSRVVLGNALNLLTLGAAAATVDAGKRADRIIKELKEKGGRTMHRNLLVVDYDTIIGADADNPDLTITATAYNRSKKKDVGEVEVPVAMISSLYSVVDPIKSAKVYIQLFDMFKGLGKGDGEKALTSSANTVNGQALIEGLSHKDEDTVSKGASAGAAAGTALATGVGSVASLAAAPAAAAAYTATKGLGQELKGDRNDDNKVSKVTKNDGSEFEKQREMYIKYLQNNGHPPFYILKPKSSNKEVDIVSTSSTGHLQGGKVYMVSMKLGEHQGATFMTPKQITEFFNA